MRGTGGVVVVLARGSGGDGRCEMEDGKMRREESGWVPGG